MANTDLNQLDKGLGFHSVNGGLGPTLGDVRLFIHPTTTGIGSEIDIDSALTDDVNNFLTDDVNNILTAGVFSAGIGLGHVTNSIIFINSPGPLTYMLPDVVAWMQEPFYQPYAPFERSIWIKDIRGNFSAVPATILPFGAQTIDGLSYMNIVQDHGLARFYPLNDLTGWFVG